MRSILLPLTCALLGACIVEAPTSDPAPGRAKATVKDVPPMNVKSGADFAGKVQLVGAEVKPGSLTAGGSATITVFYRVLDELDRDYQIFVHVEDPEGRMRRFNLDHAPAAGAYPTRQWRKGETVKDEYVLQLPGGEVPKAVDVWTGFWHPESDSRLKVRSTANVRHDGSDRVLLVQIPVTR